MLCSYPDCICAARPGGTLCAMHAQRALRGKEMAAPKRERLTPWARVVEAAIELADADAEDDSEFRRLESHLRVAARRWAGAGGRPW